MFVAKAEAGIITNVPLAIRRWNVMQRAPRNTPQNEFEKFIAMIIAELEEDSIMPTVSVTPDQDAIVSEIEILAPPERVFHALTDPAELIRWFNGGESCPTKFWKMEARLGGRYQFANQKGTLVVNGVSEFECCGEITEFDPPRLLAYTWTGNWHDDKSRSTLVRWELTPTPTGTRVKVTHSGLASLPVARKGYSDGWPGVVQSLKAFTEAANQT
jgi:uncharacterized protein YndB with AHSA1/START domain